MGRKRKPIDPSKYWKRGDLAITRRLKEPISDGVQLTQAQMDEVDDALISAGFPRNRTRPRNLILAALSHALDYQKTPYKPYVFKKLTRDTFGTDRPKGPHQKIRIRILLISALFLAWRIAFQKEPRINRKIVQKDKRTVRTDFVVFAAQILAMAKIGKVEDNLNQYRIHERSVRSFISDDED
jgi:hypothetical protein